MGSSASVVFTGTSHTAAAQGRGQYALNSLPGSHMKSLRRHRLTTAVHVSLLFSLFARDRVRAGCGDRRHQPVKTSTRSKSRVAASNKPTRSPARRCCDHPRPESAPPRSASSCRTLTAGKGAERQVQFLRQLRLPGRWRRHRRQFGAGRPAQPRIQARAGAGRRHPLGERIPRPRASAAAPTSTPFRWPSSVASKCSKTALRRSTVPTPSRRGEHHHHQELDRRAGAPSAAVTAMAATTPGRLHHRRRRRQLRRRVQRRQLRRFQGIGANGGKSSILASTRRRHQRGQIQRRRGHFTFCDPTCRPPVTAVATRPATTGSTSR